MKIILAAISLVFLCASCATQLPVDPKTGKPCERMLPCPCDAKCSICKCAPCQCAASGKGAVSDSK